MTHDELVEKVALGIANVFRDTHLLRRASSIDEFDDPEHFRKLARAALSVVAEAMREPTEEMVSAAFEPVYSSSWATDSEWWDLRDGIEAAIAASPLVEGK